MISGRMTVRRTLVPRDNADTTDSICIFQSQRTTAFSYCENGRKLARNSRGRDLECIYLGSWCFIVDLKSYYFVKFGALFRCNVSTGTDGDLEFRS